MHSWDQPDRIKIIIHTSTVLFAIKIVNQELGSNSNLDVTEQNMAEPKLPNPKLDFQTLILTEPKLTSRILVAIVL